MLGPFIATTRDMERQVDMAGKLKCPICERLLIQVFDEAPRGMALS